MTRERVLHGHETVAVENKLHKIHRLHNYCTQTTLCITEQLDKADKSLFHAVISDHHHVLHHLSFDSLFSLNISVTRGHSAKIVRKRCLDVRRHFFSECVVERWNNLDQHVIDSDTLNSFKSGLEKARQASIGFFTDCLFAEP